MRKKAIVTGASRGIGRGIIRELAAAGYDIAFSYRTREDEAKEAAEEIRNMGSFAWYAKADMAQAGEGEKFFDQAVRELGGLDLLVNNAGVTVFQSILDLEMEVDHVIKVTLTNEILKRISEIDEKRFSLSTIEMTPVIKNRLRKNSKKKSSYASNKIEGNPLTEKQANEAIDSDPHKHFLKPEQEVRNYFLALNFLEEKLKKKEAFSKEMILEVQAMVEKGASKEKIGLRGPMPPGMLFAVYDSETGAAEYIPPEYIDIPDLLDELVEYVNTTDDHPLIIAAVVHYQLVTIHPFEDGNGRTARLMSGYILDYYGYGFNGIGSLEEYFAYDPDEYYASLQMGLPALYYSGRENPPHPEIWINYFLRMMELYSKKVYELSKTSENDELDGSLSYLNAKEKEFLAFLLKKRLYEFTPIEVSKMIGVTNKTVINRCAKLVNNGLLIPIIVKTRVRSYRLSDFSKTNEKKILKKIS